MPVGDRITVDVATAAKLVGLSRAAFYPLVMSGDVPSFKVGRRRLVPVAGLESWVARAASRDGEVREPAQDAHR